MRRQQIISIIDDDDAVRDSLAALVEADGHAVALHGSGEAFLAARSAEAADCVVLDLQLPGMSGLDVLNRLAADRPAPPVILITGRSYPGLREQALRAGACALLQKPLPNSTILDTIHGALEARAKPAGAG